MGNEDQTAICPGSYDPVTNGHLDIIERAAKVFQRVIVGVVNEPLRKQKTLFTAAERKQFLLQATTKHDNVEIEVFDTLLVDFARKHSARALVKGLRAISDFEWEFEMNQLNRKLAPEIESVYLMASPQYSFLSSSGVKEIATFGASVDDLVPPAVAKALHDLLDQMRATIPEEIKQARWIVKERQEMLAEAKREAERIVKEARDQQQRLVSQEEVTKQAERGAEEIVEDANARAREIRLGAEDYADEILNTLEVNLQKFLAAVQRGRDRLAGREQEPAEVG
jgi:pantetheine-phosphate adenylyltransferase